MRLAWFGCVLVFAAACKDNGDDDDFVDFPDSGAILGPGLADSGSAVVTSDAGSSGAPWGGTASGGAFDAGVIPATDGAVWASDAGSLSSDASGNTASDAGALDAASEDDGATVSTEAGSVEDAMADAGESDASAPGAHDLPCDVQKVLKDKCQTCHSSPPTGAPMPLVTWDDLQAAAYAAPGKKVFERIAVRINEEAAKAMPPTGAAALTEDEKATLNQYIAAGAKPTTANCDADPCEMRMELRAHGAQTQTDTTPFVAPSGGNHSEVFWFTPTWTEKMQTIAVRPIMDNAAVFHHWLLYMYTQSDKPSGSHGPVAGLASTDAQLLSGWAAGHEMVSLDESVGLQTIYGPNARFALEVHYSTSSNPTNRSDRSGVELCLTSKLRAHEAAAHWLGTQQIAGIGRFDATGTCTPMMESHVIATSPLMRQAGTYIKTLVKHADGTSVPLTDRAFSYQDQGIYPIAGSSAEVLVKPGDVISTTCTYNASQYITSSSETCYNLVFAWPAGSLRNTMSSAVAGVNTCIDTP